MADIGNELMFELLKKIQSDIASMKDGQRDLRSDYLSIRNQLHLMQGDMNGVRTSMAHIEQRLGRIDSRSDGLLTRRCPPKRVHDGFSKR